MKILYQFNEKTGRVYRIIELNGRMFLQTLWKNTWKIIKTISANEYALNYRSEAEAYQRGERK
jgi:hypothetical protein